MDKQALKKHHFWILLGLAVILIPIALSGAVWGVGAAAEDKDKKNKEKLTTLQKQQVKSDDYREKLEKQKLELQARKNIVWEQAYQAQEGLLMWPDALRHLNPPNDKYFGDMIEVQDRDRFQSNDVYLAEYNKLPDIIAPTEFADRRWQDVLLYVHKFDTLPTPEEVWLALEDLCVQREVLRDIHAVNQMIAEFLPVPQPPKAPAKPKTNAEGEVKNYQTAMAAYLKEKSAYDAAKAKVDEELKASQKVHSSEVAGRFISPYWQLDLVVGKPQAGGRAGEMEFRGKLTNTSGRRQNVAQIEFKVWLRNPTRGTVDPIVLPVQAEYLADQASVEFKATRPGIADSPLTIYKVEQKLDPRYVPVKQVVLLKMGTKALSHRFADKDLVRSAISEEEVKKLPPAPPPAPGAAPGAPGAAAAPDVDTTPNGLSRKRYLERTEQVRRMPVAITMIVDQSHVQDVLRALSNSRLRFQNTQIHYERFRGLLSMDGGGGAADVPPGPAFPGPGRGPDPLAGRMRRGRENGPAGRPLLGGVPGDNPSAEDEASSNLVELTVYGLISLYERYPPKAPATGAPGVPSQPAAPGAAPAPPPGAPAVPAPPPPSGAPVPPAAGTPGGNLPPPAPTGNNPTATNPAAPPPASPPAPTTPKP
jgi:hypothetical protein